MAEERKAIALLGGIPAEQRPPHGDLIYLRCRLPDTQAAARPLGARDLLVKPILLESLWRSIERLGQPVRSVLIADDEPDMVRLLQQILVPRIAARGLLRGLQWRGRPGHAAGAQAGPDAARPGDARA